MDGNIVFFFCFIVIVFAILMGTIKEVAKRQMAFKERQLELEHGGGARGIDSETAARIEQMEQRLRVLERIATDSNATPSAELAREIEALRHAQEAGPGDAGVPLNLKEKVQ